MIPNTTWRRVSSVLFALSLAVAGCKGEKGDPGPTGATGATGAQGQQGQQGPQGVIGPTGQVGAAGPIGVAGPAGDPGVNNPGELALTVQFGTVNGTAVTATAAPGIRCFTNPDFTGNTADAVAEATTNSSGKIVLELAAGSYTFQCRPTNGDYQDNIPQFTVAISAGVQSTYTITGVNRLNPLYFTTAPSVSGTRLPGSAVTVSTGAVSDAAATFTVTPAATNLTAVTLDGSNAFTMPTLADMLAAVETKGLYPGFKLLPRPGFLGFGGTVTKSLANAWAFNVTATDAANHTVTSRVTVSAAGLQAVQGLAVGPLGVMVVADAGTATGPFTWTLTPPATSTATLSGADTRNPYFTPDLEGTYTLANGTTTLTFYGAKYNGVTTSGCGCHNTYVQALGYSDVVDYWLHAGGKHGNHNYFDDPASRATGATGAQSTFRWGLEGGIDYAPNCYSCHTVGSWTAPTVANGSFRSLMTTIDPAMNAAWEGDGLDHWASLDPTLKALGGIQCESCHGPASQHNGGPRIGNPFASEACAVCHDSPAHHDKYNLWARSGHASLEGSIAEASNEQHPGNESCGRCHAGQGFVDYLAQQQNSGADCTSYQDKTGAALTNLIDSNGNPVYAGSLMSKVNGVCRVLATGTSETQAVRDVGIAYLAGIGLTEAKIQPQTCATCHEAHSTELRVEGSTGPLAAGFQVDGAGAGALCMVCHNGRNGPRGDGVVRTSIAAPHAPTQAEVLMGQNVYWVNGYMSAHAAVADTCVGCHVKIPREGVTHNDNHTFIATEAICKECHSTLVTPEALFGRWARDSAALKAAMLKSLGSSFQIVGSSRTITVDATQTGAKITGYGRSGATFTFAVAIENPNAATGTLAIGTALNVAANKLIDANGTAVAGNGRFAKAGWNLAMVPTQAAAVHNPTFTFQVLTISAQKVVDTTAGAL